MGLDDGAVPDGAIFHWVAATEDGMIVVDVWKTIEQFDAFARDQIGPFSAQAGIQGPPEMTRYAVHNMLPH
jgi:hypothetical protein